MDDSTSVSETTAPLWVVDFGCTDYTTVWQWQQTFRDRRIRREIPDVLMVGEHPPVITLGRGTDPANVQNPTIPVIEIERGGDVTYHGPGQLVAYPICYLPEGQRSLHGVLRTLEAVIMGTLQGYGLKSCRNEGYTGVWLPGSQEEEATSDSVPVHKIASIGIAVRKWVTYHGIALNVTTDLAPYFSINPCGLESSVMTTMARWIEPPPAMAQVKERFVDQYCQWTGHTWQAIPERDCPAGCTPVSLSP